MTRETFQTLIATVTDAVAGRPLDADLDAFLNARFPPGGAEFQAIVAACKAAVAEGWMCEREHGGIKFGRVIKPCPELAGFSVDVVEMENLAGPHHVHPNGEIDLIMPQGGDPTFDGRPAGWCVYGPGSAHRPTVAGGRAHILYLLPQGAIEFSRG